MCSFIPLSFQTRGFDQKQIVARGDLECLRISSAICLRPVICLLFHE